MLDTNTPWCSTHPGCCTNPGCYTRVLRVVLNINQDEHIINKRVQGITKYVREDGSKEDETSWSLPRHQELPAEKLVLWEPTRGHRSRGRPTPTVPFVDVIKKVAGAESTNELARRMENRDDCRRGWRARPRMT